MTTENKKNELVTAQHSQPKQQQSLTPMDLLQSAQQANASIEQMQQLFDLQLRWEENEARKAYNQAIADFKAEGVKIVKNKTVAFGNTKYTHATIGNVVEVVTPIMSKHGLRHAWDVKQDGPAITVTCKVSHVQGHSESVQLTSGPDSSGQKNAIQQVASTVTYLQRYTLLSALGLATDDSDDDGRASEPKVEVINEEQRANLEALIAETGTDPDKFCVFFRVASVEEIPAKSYAAAVKALEQKRGGK